ncbi:MAG TPA: hypothetical protein VF308_17185 [Caldimonas sp.]
MHGLEHVADQGIEFGRAESLDRLGDAQQARVAADKGETLAVDQVIVEFE